MSAFSKVVRIICVFNRCFQKCANGWFGQVLHLDSTLSQIAPERDRSIGRSCDMLVDHDNYIFRSRKDVVKFTLSCKKAPEIPWIPKNGQGCDKSRFSHSTWSHHFKVYLIAVQTHMR